MKRRYELKYIELAAAFIRKYHTTDQALIALSEWQDKKLMTAANCRRTAHCILLAQRLGVADACL